MSSRSSGFRRRDLRLRNTEPTLCWHAAAHDIPAQELLRNTLRSACDLIGAERGFVVVLREETTLEVACARQMAPREMLDTMLGRAARALHRALTLRETGLCDERGNTLAAHPGDHSAAAVVSLPLELGVRQRGALCLLRACAQRALSSLDFEILEALAGQAALALAAASQQSALHRLEASLNATPSS